MLDNLNYEQFSQCLGSKFRLQLESEAPLELELIEATSLGTQNPSSNRKVRLEPFSLVFRSAKDIYLPQRIYKLEHATLGELELFLVPIAGDKDGLYYEAVFN